MRFGKDKHPQIPAIWGFVPSQGYRGELSRAHIIKMIPLVGQSLSRDGSKPMRWTYIEYECFKPRVVFNMFDNVNINLCKSTGYEWVECLNHLNLLITHLWDEHAFPWISWVSQDDMFFPWKLQPEFSVLASRLGIERNPLIQCASRLGDQDQLMLEALDTFDTFDTRQSQRDSAVPLTLQSIAQSIAKDLESPSPSPSDAWDVADLCRCRSLVQRNTGAAKKDPILLASGWGQETSRDTHRGISLRSQKAFLETGDSLD